MAAEGADILDVGGESTRPGHVPISAAEEIARTEEVVKRLSEQSSVPVSIDTYKLEVAEAAVAAGATIINDVWGLVRSPGLADLASRHKCALVVMHNQEGATYPDGVVAAVIASLREAADNAIRLGVPRERLLVDPGIGFGKATAQSLELLHRLREIREAVGLPLVVGTSRKRFIGEILGGASVDERVEGTAASVALAIAGGADVVRVHDVAHIARTVRVADAIVRFHPR